MKDTIIKIKGLIYSGGATSGVCKTIYINTAKLTYVNIESDLDFSVMIENTKIVNVKKAENAALVKWLEENDYEKPDHRSQPRNTAKKQRLVEGN